MRVRVPCSVHAVSSKAECDHAPFCLQPLKVVDPDHPLAMLVRKAQADSPAPTPPSAEGAAGQPSQVEYTSDCEYLAGRTSLSAPTARASCRA